MSLINDILRTAVTNKASECTSTSAAPPLFPREPPSCRPVIPDRHPGRGRCGS